MPHDKAEVTMRRGPSSKAVAALAATWLVAVTTSGRTDVPPVQRLHLASFSMAPHADAPFEEEGRRMADLCPGWERACVARHLRPVTRRIATLQAEPSATSPVVGWVVARLQAGDHGLALDVERAGASGERAVWLPGVGDHTYGIHVAGVRPRAEWVQFAGLPLVGDAWTLRDGPDWTAHVTPLDDGTVVDLDPVEAMFPDGSTRLTERGSYVVTDIHGDRVSFRAEIATDFDCGADVQPPPVMPPILRAPAGAFFGPDGAPRFAEKYTKGC
jgi:hypothetical protein